MIHHVSIPAREPRRVAAVLAELMGGHVSPFAPVDGAFAALVSDGHGTMIEVYPEGAAMLPGADDNPVGFVENERPPQGWPFHLLLSVALDEAAILGIGAREGWRAKRFGRGRRGAPPSFHVIEFWLEDRLMIEVATQEMTREYLAARPAPTQTIGAAA
jgi:hypothetical protein